MSEINFRGKKVPVTKSEEQDIELGLSTDLVNDWLKSLDSSINLNRIEVQSIDRFTPTRIGFVKIKSDVERNNKKIPGICQLRGGAVAILLEVTCVDTNELYSILVKQPRVPTGRVMYEIPAGMLDGDNDIKARAIEELEEECGLKCNVHDLIDMTKMVYGDTHSGCYTSPGVLDQFIVLLLWKIRMTKKELEELEGKVGGVDEHEQITLHVVKFSDIHKYSPCMTVHSALNLYYNLKAENRI